jgi:hypothetical protein
MTGLLIASIIVGAAALAVDVKLQERDDTRPDSPPPKPEPQTVPLGMLVGVAAMLVMALVDAFTNPPDEGAL